MSLAFVRGIHRWPVNSPHKGPVTRKMFPFDDVIMIEAKHVCEPFHSGLNELKNGLSELKSFICIDAVDALLNHGGTKPAALPMTYITVNPLRPGDA